MNNNPSIPLPIYYSLIAILIIFPLIANSLDNVLHESTLELLDEMLMPEPQLWELGVVGIAIVVTILIFIGLFMRKEWARKAYIYTFIPAYFVYLLPFARWSYMTGLATIFDSLAFVCSGILLLILILPQLYQPLFYKDKVSK